MKTIEEEIQTNVASEIYTYIAIPINSLKQSNDIIQSVQPMQIASNVIYNVLPHDGTNEKIQTYTLTDQFIETLRENDKEHDVLENQESLRPTVIEQISNTRKSVILETSLNKDEALTYECLNCGEVFKTRQCYRKHVEKHKEKLYKCDECSASYNCEVNFKLHKVVHTKNATVCPVCEKSFNRMASLKNHLTFHEIEETFTCTECWASFDAEEEYNKHIQNHKSEAQSLQIFLVCSVCDEKFEDRAKYKQHILFHTEVKKLLKTRKTPKKRKAVKRTPSHLCDVCKKSFTKYCLLIRHKRIHTGEKPYVCHFCDRAFAQKGTLRIHLKIHTGLKPFKCTICMAKFSQKCNLRAHVQRTHLHGKSSENIYSCQLCACSFKRIASLNAHTTRFHRADKDGNDIIDLMLQINQLENQMNTKCNLPVNDILRRNVIEDDSEKFVRLADSSVEGPIQYFLVKQKKTTEGLWYACSYCEKEFKKPSDLIRHIRIHTMQKPFKCKHCNRRFSLKSTLNNHVVSHANIRSYECVICKTTFNSKKTLKNNKIDDKFVCGSCKPVASDFKVKRVNVEKLETLRALNNLNINIELKQPMVESSEGLVPIISPKAKIHSDSANTNRPKLHRCHCGAEFFQIKKLQHHMLIHTSEKKFKCFVCTKGFHNSQTLKEHIKSVHNGERKFLCRICDKRFVTNTILKRHMITHSFVKPYICPYCKKRFKTILHCRQHIKLHKKDILLNALTSDEANKFTTSFVAEAALPENMFANTLPDGPYNLGLNFDNLTDSTAANLLSEASESVEQNKDESETQILYTDKGNGVIVSTSLNISQIHDEKHKLEQQLLLTSTALPSYDESTKNITTHNLENVDDSIATLPQENSTVFLNFDDLNLSTSNLYSSYPNLKNFDQLLGEISDIQDNNILLTSDSSLSQLTDSQLDTSNFDGLMPFAFNTNISLNNVTLSTTNPFPNVILSSVNEEVPLPDLSFDVKKSSGVEESQKMLDEKDENPLLANLLETSSSSEPIIPNTDETIFENVDFTCTSCKKYLDNVDDLMHHYCTGKVAAEEIAKENQNDGLPSYEDSIQTKKKLKNGHKCKKCNRTFTTKLGLQKHVGVHKEKKNSASNICSYCEKGFKKHSDLLRHVRTHTGEKPFTCDMCQKNFTLKSTLETHRRTHNPESHQKYDCGVCGTHVSSKASLRVHMMMHTGAKPYQCSVCFENFRTSGHRRSHMRTHLNNNKGRKQSKSAKVTTMLQSVITETQNNEELYEEVLLLNNSQHLQENKELTLHDSEVLFPNQTVQVDSLILQQLQQSCVLLDDGNERIPPFIQVDINNYGEITNVKSIRDIQESFKTTGPDKSIENIYLTEKASPERNFECDICHKKYTTKSVLTKHKRIHNKLNCAKCNIKFTQSEELQEHLKIHNVLRPFACSLCDNSFSLKKNLITHMKRIHSTSFP